MTRAIIFGANHHNTLGVIRSLGRKGIYPEVLLHSTLPANKCNNLKSRYIKSWHKVDSCEEGVKYLCHTISEGERPVIICCSDNAASAIDKRYDELKNHYIIPNCGRQGRMTELMNKEAMSELAVECGLEVPKTILVEQAQLCDDIPFPCITKPLLSIEGNKADIQICHTRDELNSVLNKSECPRFQVQKFIDKAFEYQLIGLSLEGGKTVIIPGRSRIITQPICTNTGYLHYEHLDGKEPIVACEKFLQTANYSGLFSMEFMRGKDGKNYFMEINFRNDGNSICVTEAGVNLHYIWYVHSIGAEWKQEAEKEIRELYVMPEFTELNLWYQGSIRITRFIREMMQADVFMDYAKDDPAPTRGFGMFMRDAIVSTIKKPAFFLKHKVFKL